MAAARGSRARALQVVGAACVGVGLFVTVLMWAAFHAAAAVRFGVGIVIVGVLLLALAAVLRRIGLLRR